MQAPTTAQRTARRAASELESVRARADADRGVSGSRGGQELNRRGQAGEGGSISVATFRRRRATSRCLGHEGARDGRGRLASAIEFVGAGGAESDGTDRVVPLGAGGEYALDFAFGSHRGSFVGGVAPAARVRTQGSGGGGRAVPQIERRGIARRSEGLGDRCSAWQLRAPELESAKTLCWSPVLARARSSLPVASGEWGGHGLSWRRGTARSEALSGRNTGGAPLDRSGNGSASR